MPALGTLHLFSNDCTIAVQIELFHFQFIDVIIPIHQH